MENKLLVRGDVFKLVSGHMVQTLIPRGVIKRLEFDSTALIMHIVQIGAYYDMTKDMVEADLKAKAEFIAICTNGFVDEVSALTFLQNHLGIEKLANFKKVSFDSMSLLGEYVVISTDDISKGELNTQTLHAVQLDNEGTIHKDSRVIAFHQGGDGIPTISTLKVVRSMKISDEVRTQLLDSFKETNTSLWCWIFV